MIQDKSALEVDRPFKIDLHESTVIKIVWLFKVQYYYEF